ncbi:hypothetical protein [uncultured Kocuria sp.]|uniref:hypothetical protein n=1 Tax=uncultured Kocuria sp. TaxID=259305 RepID=UPI00262765CE|nr:hypothetical protein [uncultured Kocuria sp.]
MGTQIDYNVVVDGRYYPARASIYMTGSASTGETNQVINEVLLGNPQNEPYTAQQLYNLIKSAQGLPALAPALKKAYTDAVNVAVG